MLDDLTKDVLGNPYIMGAVFMIVVVLVLTILGFISLCMEPEIVDYGGIAYRIVC